MRRSQYFCALCVASIALAGCTDGAQTARSAEPTTALARRERPSARSVERAFARVQDDVTRCFSDGLTAVRVRGSFDGDDGGFALERATTVTGGTVSYAVSTCVRTMVERARVRPFRAESHSAEHDFVAPPGTNSSASNSANNSAGRASSAGVTSSASAGTTANMRIASSPEELVRREHNALEHCFEQASEQAAELEGEIEVRFVLDALGRVSNTGHRVLRERNGSGLLALVGQCVESHVRLIAFGAQADGGGTHVVPIAFGGREHFAPANAPHGSLPVE
jgi:hypothetical protein